MPDVAPPTEPTPAPATAAPPDLGPQLVANADGTVFRAPADKLASILASGAYHTLTPDELLKHQVHKEEESKGLVGSLSEAGSSALNQLLLGAPEAVAEHTLSPEDLRRRELVQAEHPAARFLGGAAGVAGSLAFGGELFKAADLAGQAVSRGIAPAAELADAALHTKLLGTAANYATQGALLASPQAVVHAAFGDPQKAAETLFWGIGAGAALGGGSELLAAAGRGVGAGVGKILESDLVRGKLDEVAQEYTPKALGAQQSQLRKLSQERIGEITDFAHEEEIVGPGMTKEDIAKAVESTHKKYGGELAETLKSLDESLLDPSKAAGRVREAGLKPAEIPDALRKALDTEELRMPMNADQRRALDLVIDSAAKLPTQEINGQSVVKFEDAQNFVSSLRRKWVGAVGKAQNEGGVAGVETVTPLDRMKSAAYQVARDTLHQAGDRVALASDQPALVGQLVKSKAAYSKVAEIEKWVARSEHQEGMDRFTELRNTLQEGGEGGFIGRAAQAVGTGLGGLLGGGVGALVGERAGKVAGSLLQHLADKWGEERGLVTISALAKRAAKEGPEVFSSVMAMEGAKRLSATMTGVSDAVRNMATRGIVETHARTQEHMAALLGSTQGLTPDQQYNKLGARLTELNANPAAMAEVTSAAAAPFETVAPEVAAAYQQKTAQALSYLYGALPKAPSPPAPFAPQTWQPSAADKLAFHDRAEIVNNPMRAVQHMQQGTLSDAHLDALQTIYPQVFGQMKSEVLKLAAEHPDMKLPLAERQSVARFVGSSLDTLDTPDQVRALQAAYVGSPKGDGPPPGESMPKGKIKDMPSRASAFAETLGPAEAA